MNELQVWVEKELDDIHEFTRKRFHVVNKNFTSVQKGMEMLENRINVYDVEKQTIYHSRK